MQPKYRFSETQFTVSPLKHSATRLIEIASDQGGSHQVNAGIRWLDHCHGELTVNGVVRHIYAVQDDQTLHVHMDGKVWQVDIVDEFSDAGGASDQAESGLVKAPMPGVVLDISVKEGDQVEEGQLLMLIESMKLQMEVKASLSGTVLLLGVDGVGASFDKGAQLVNIRPHDESLESGRKGGE
ncbi:acetyl-CoA carboxylase biotin carboxyl carrier protein subunit [Endozoicomonas elysicola]|uniref:acetyl-CoA carboxylase biotin carboxyl carrier protein subunit n=1 Tax=Endozoicomonas elysicola TaxID=305900 RepID=UPI00036F83C0|nr:biotin/lipoyl-containing protein [Endozoicomonas elysicola]